jgi:hypothetical protein
LLVGRPLFEALREDSALPFFKDMVHVAFQEWQRGSLLEFMEISGAYSFPSITFYLLLGPRDTDHGWARSPKSTMHFDAEG